MDDVIIDSKYLYLKPRSSIRFNIVLVVMLMWTLSQLLVPIKFISYDLLVKVEFLKTVIPIVAVVVSTFLYVNRLRVDSILWPFILFILFILFISIVKLIFFNASLGIYQDAVKYILWIFAMFVLFPVIFNSLYKIRLFLRLSIVTIFLTLASSLIVLFLSGDDFSTFINESRLEFIYGNPLYFGAIAYALLCCSMILRELATSSFEKYILLSMAALSLWLIYMSNARTFMLATLVFFLVYSFNIGNDRRKMLFISFLTLLFVVGMFFVIFSEIDFNSLSSNRFVIWEAALNTGMDFWKIILGNYNDSGYLKELKISSDESVVQSFQRFAVDNVYIEIFINTGLFGVLLFILGLKNLFSKRMEKQLKRTNKGKELTRVLYIAYGVLVSLIFSGIFYGHYPSFGNVINSSVFPVVIAIIFVFRKYIFEIKRVKIE